jgi:hypothetical protein
MTGIAVKNYIIFSQTFETSKCSYVLFQLKGV